MPRSTSPSSGVRVARSPCPVNDDHRLRPRLTPRPGSPARACRARSAGPAPPSSVFTSSNITAHNGTPNIRYIIGCFYGPRLPGDYPRTPPPRGCRYYTTPRTGGEPRPPNGTDPDTPGRMAHRPDTHGRAPRHERKGKHERERARVGLVFRWWFRRGASGNAPGDSPSFPVGESPGRRNTDGRDHSFIYGVRCPYAWCHSPTGTPSEHDRQAHARTERTTTKKKKAPAHVPPCAGAPWPDPAPAHTLSANAHG